MYNKCRAPTLSINGPNKYVMGKVWSSGALFHWSYGALLITGFWAHLVWCLFLKRKVGWVTKQCQGVWGAVCFPTLILNSETRENSWNTVGTSSLISVSFRVVIVHETCFDYHISIPIPSLLCRVYDVKNDVGNSQINKKTHDIIIFIGKGRSRRDRLLF